jgi:HSP20 family protein
MEDLYDRMGWLVQDVFGGTSARSGPVAQWTAPADIEEMDDSFLVEIDLPGVAPEDLNLELSDNQLRISGEIKDREHAGVMRRKGRRVGQFEHVLALPGEIDPDRVEATLTDGVLRVRLHKSAADKARRIEVKS